MIWKKFILPTLLLAILLYTGYKWLSNSSELEYSVTESGVIELHGYEFKGRPTNPEVKNYFFAMRELSSFEEGEMLTVINFGTEANVDELDQFIGTQAKLDRPDTLSEYTIPSGKYIEVILDMAPLYRPSPVKVYEGALEYANQNNMRLGDWSIEAYGGEDLLIVRFPVVN